MRIATRFRLTPIFLLTLNVILTAAYAFSSSYRVLYRFQGGADGAAPVAAMIADSVGNLYGTTPQGGGGSCSGGCGTVFELSPPAVAGGEWTETILYVFLGGTDGAAPMTPLIRDAAGNLYGSTTEGGNGNCHNLGQSGCGTIFELSPPSDSDGGWSHDVIYNFQGVPSGNGNGDAAVPFGLAFGEAGDIFGFGLSGGWCFTDETGTYCSRAAFRLHSAGGKWTEAVIFRFTDSYSPYAGPIFDKLGNMYGAGPGGAYGAGAVFSLHTSNGKWSLVPIYDFHGLGDGALPEFGLSFVKGGIVGADLGFANSFGSVFEVSPSGRREWYESVIFNFNPLSTGYSPSTGPIPGANGHLFGATTQGGTSNAGVIYELLPPQSKGGQWTENVLYNFSPGNDGDFPSGGLNFGKGGMLYGTAQYGGDTNCSGGCGTVYQIAP